ncbi:tRNA (cytosine(38)-C(5))-methyltransferase [Dermatophagoides pteronyssinus]|uniref:tRNA (cytosine(38)-C(5))-methyltransferase n=1 Tax=Dermatophagoides pteronyssinus TaxID=6956 RepID=UPI003F674A08
MDRSCFKVLELYSGIGGFNFAIKELFEEEKSIEYYITAIDINTSANIVYRLNHNFNNKCKLLEHNIESLTSDDFDRMNLDLLTISPPCQPFSRLGNQLDLKDSRSSSFKHLMQLFPSIRNKPRFIMLENVKGFEISNAHQLFISTLQDCKYRIREFLLSPDQFGIPNSRLRYYLLAKHESGEFQDEENVKISTLVPLPHGNSSIFSHENVEYKKNIRLKEFSLKNYLEKDENFDIRKFQLTDEQLLRYHMIIDIVDPENSMAKTNCFTKSYGHRLEGCGSILKTSEQFSIDEIFSAIQKTSDSATIIKLLHKLKLRLFTPKEIANLMCFPCCLEFPGDFTTKQRYRLLGNSVNVLVCNYLLKILLGPLATMKRKIE